MPSVESSPAHRQSSLPVTPAKTASAVNVAVAEMNHSQSSGDESPVTATMAANSLQKVSSTSSLRITHVVKVTREIKEKLITEIGVEASFFSHMSLDAYLDFISEERLLHMPRKGSQWDRVLKSAEYFGLQICNFSSYVGAFVLDSKSASHAALASCQLLLEVSDTPDEGSN